MAAKTTSAAKRLLRLFALICLLAVCAAAAVFALWYQDNRRANFTSFAEVYIYPGTDASSALEQIASKAGVKNRRSLVRSFEKKQVDSFITPGHYSIQPSHSSVYVARMLNNGWQTPVRLTLEGNLRLKSGIASKISSQLLVDSLEVIRALEDEKLLSGYGFTPRDVFSLLVPATYQIYWTATMEDFLDIQKKAYDSFWTSANDAKAAALGLSRKQVSILASIVKGETNYVPEMPKIAGVYLNRLEKGMLLQADPTVAFCFDYKPTRILNKHLRVDSPYNTYIHPGLPPGPICVPTKDALEAVLNPDYGSPVRGQGNFYFCANPDFTRTHVFARTLSEHNRNADAFRAELNRRSRH
ncbi:MAG: endolytic transglycosylase MltG [Bacteroidales bacterium]|nr:endolytic transglycosylase MltG [Bacteroidales bacterium]